MPWVFSSKVTLNHKKREDVFLFQIFFLSTHIFPIRYLIFLTCRFPYYSHVTFIHICILCNVGRRNCVWKSHHVPGRRIFFLELFLAVRKVCMCLSTQRVWVWKTSTKKNQIRDLKPICGANWASIHTVKGIFHSIFTQCKCKECCVQHKYIPPGIFPQYIRGSKIKYKNV